jgi:hypothetical protein
MNPEHIITVLNWVRKPEGFIAMIKPFGALPLDARITACNYAPESHSWLLRIESEEYEEVEPGHTLPEIKYEYDLFGAQYD